MKFAKLAAVASLLTAATVQLAATTPASAGDVQGDAYDCGELYVMRNEIYKSAGYCFKSAKAISQFGNAGCQYDSLADVPLPANQRSQIRGIKKSESRQGC
ncbi:MAG: YARHG domain-containing protein [Hyphomicrobium sp.]|nr:YARHG domain-containing protein [Hyphomicrobium sp.]